MKSKGHVIFILVLSLIFLTRSTASAQGDRMIVSNYLSSNFQNLGLVEADIDKWGISDSYLTKHNGVTHIHIQQRYNGIDVFNGVCNFALNRDQEVVHTASSLHGNLSTKTNALTFQISQDAAVTTAMRINGLNDVEIVETEIKPVYFHHNETLHLSYHVVMTTVDHQHVWNIMVDGLNGAILSHWDQVIHCSFENPSSAQLEKITHVEHAHEQEVDESSARRSASLYNVFAVPVESPSHGVRSLEIAPEDSAASPFGWHDNNAQPGADFTFTRGNNVFAFEDADNNGVAGYSPDGGPDLLFDFPFTEDVAPEENMDAALTNLFYMNNIIHDVLHAYGFDETSGNFQSNNYGNGGSQGDAVWAQGFDGGGLNNATFFTPIDGLHPTMSMFLWNSGGIQEFLTVNSPSEIEGPYITTGATFGPGIPATPLTADVVLYEDGTEPFNDACQPATNGNELNGKIAMIDRIECTFVNKIIAAQNAGAVGVIMVNNVLGGPITMGGSSGTVNIPSVMISLADGNSIKAQLSDGETVNVTIVDSSAGMNLLDGNFDNAIIAHEYGHGISNRLIGGRFNTNCMNNNEQMGEGWSDWYGLMLTMNMNADNPVNRPMGTYVVREPVTGNGIRPVPYDTSMTVNPFTYGNLGDNNISIPHGVGFIWSTMLWDLTWAFIEEYGFDPDVAHGNGGNNIILQLVTDGLKLTNCSPGFVNGRDAILMADEINNEGANQCLIWETFARRGLGFSASQGGVFNVNDGSEAFDLPPACLPSSENINADYIVDQTISCDGEIEFTDMSEGEVTAWLWDFGDGNTSTEQNPVHEYTEAGTFTVSLTVTGDVEMDNLTITDLITIVIIEDPTGVQDAMACAGESVMLTASSPNTLQWYDAANNVLGNGSPFTTPVLETTTSFFVSDIFSMDDASCESEKVEVVVEVLSADFNSTEDDLTVTFEDLSENATSWAWDFGDGTSSTDQNPVHVYNSPGMYDVTLTIDGICIASAMINAISTGIEDLFQQGGLALIPNPAGQSTMISSDISLPKDAMIRLIGVDGRKLWEMNISYSINEVEIDLSDVASGIYQVVISLDNTILAQRKLVVSKQE